MSRKNQAQLGVTRLEGRDTPAVFAHFAATTGTLTVTVSDSNAGPAGAVRVSDNNSSQHHTADVAGDANTSNARLRVNGFSLDRNNGPVNQPNGNNLVRTSEVKSIVVNGSASADYIRLDRMDSSQGWQNLNGRITVHGGSGNDTISGSQFAEYLYGDAGNDRLEGRGGNDYLDGGAGTDTAVGFIVGKDTKNGIEILV